MMKTVNIEPLTIDSGKRELSTGRKVAADAAHTQH